MATKKLTIERLHQLLTYDPETGLFSWNALPGRGRIHRAGLISGAGQPSTGGYLTIRVDGHLHRAHRLAWYYVHGEWPATIDHINRVKTDNRLSNLRPANRLQQSWNAKKSSRGSYPKGVWKKRDKFCAEIQVHGVKHRLGVFSTPEAAHAAYSEAARQHFGDFASTG